MQKGFLKYQDSKIHFHRFGKGEKLLIALHGFADESSLFLKLENSLKEKYTIYSIDLPFHGLTQWGKNNFDRKDISAIFRIILEKENKDRLDLMGYSLGGRIVQKMLFEWIDRLETIYLIAPDGLATKWFFNVNLMPRWFKSFVKWLLSKPDWFIRMIKRFYRWGWISRFIYNFAYYHIHTKEKRERIFCTWHSLEHFRLYPGKVKKLLKKYPIPVYIYLGTRDEVIPQSVGKILGTNMTNVQVFEIEEGHLLIDEKLNELLKKQLGVV